MSETADQTWALITGFGPFANHPSNPSTLIVARLPEQINGVKLLKYELPVDYRLLNGLYRELGRHFQIKNFDCRRKPLPGEENLLQEENEENNGVYDSPIIRQRFADIFAKSAVCPPRFIVHLGVSAATNCILLEERAYNETVGLDITGYEPADGKISPGGASLLRSPLRLSKIVARVSTKDQQCKNMRLISLSYDAGRYLCNYSYYKALEFSAASSGTQGLFIHVPKENEPLTLDQMTAIVQQSLDGLFEMEVRPSLCAQLWTWIRGFLDGIIHSFGRIFHQTHKTTPTGGNQAGESSRAMRETNGGAEFR